MDFTPTGPKKQVFHGRYCVCGKCQKPGVLRSKIQYHQEVECTNKQASSSRELAPPHPKKLDGAALNKKKNQGTDKKLRDRHRVKNNKVSSVWEWGSRVWILFGGACLFCMGALILFVMKLVSSQNVQI